MTPAPDHYALWRAANGCSHGHCPHGCEHPQPVPVVVTGETAVRLVCGRCWCVGGEVSEMVPCDPNDC